MELNLPAHFQKNIRLSFGQAGEEWLYRLPVLLGYAAKKWGLEIQSPMQLSYNYVTSARRADGSEVILKLGVPNREFISEYTALRFYNGQGCVRLLELDEEQSMFLLERLIPGTMLVDLKNDEERTRIACEVMLNLWRTAPDGLPFIQLADWFADLRNIRAKFGGGTGPFPLRMIEKIERLLPELFQSSSRVALIHGDFHHFNVLSSGRGWLAIDPKGIVGPSEYECGPYLINPFPDFAYRSDAVHITERRIAVMSECLGFTRESIRAWGFCHAVLSSWWDTNVDGTGGEYSLACAEVIEGTGI